MSELSRQGFIDACERDQLQYLQGIQPDGALLGGATGDPLVRFASANLSDWLGWESGAALGRSLTSLLSDFPPPPTELEDIEAEPGAWMHPMSERRLYPNLFMGPCGWLDGLLSCNERNWLLELEPALPPELQKDAYRPVPHRLYRMPYTESDWARYCQFVADELRSVTGFDRVMVYRFRDDGCGEVISESLVEGIAPYLGLRYPASDIPLIARTLYLANRHRQISDRDVEPVPIEALDDLRADLTLSDLRAVAPVHLEYLANMGVRASLSFSVILHGRLWGLIACHHAEVRCLPLPVRERCADMAQVFSMAIAGYRSHRSLQEVTESDYDIGRLIDALRCADAGQPYDSEAEGSLGDVFMSLVGASGAALIDGGRIVGFGDIPDEAGIRDQLEWLREQVSEPIFATDGLSQLCPTAAAWSDCASGLLVVQVSGLMGGGVDRAFMWWRPEQPRTVTWAGDPRKSALFDEQTQRLSPRASFEQWIETTSGHSEPWSDADLLRAKKFRSLVLRDIRADILVH